MVDAIGIITIRMRFGDLAVIQNIYPHGERSNLCEKSEFPQCIKCLYYILLQPHMTTKGLQRAEIMLRQAEDSDPTLPL